MRVEVVERMILSKVVGGSRMVQHETILKHEWADSGDVPFRSINHHLKWQYGQLENRLDLKDATGQGGRTFAGPFRTLASILINPLPNNPPRLVATFCSTTPNESQTPLTGTCEGILI